MSLLTLPPPASSSAAGRAARLLAGVYGQHVQDLKVTDGQQLSFESGSKSTREFADVVEALVDAAGKRNDAFGTAEDSQALVRDWLARVGRGEFEDERGAQAADKELLNKTFIVGESVTVADLSLFASVHPYIASCTHSSLLSHPCITRHFDHVQNLPALAAVLPTVFEPAHVSIDVNNVPVVEIKQDVKVKKPKAKDGAEPAAGVAAADGAASVKDAAKKVEQVAKDAVAAVTGSESTLTAAEKKPKKDKKKDAAAGGGADKKSKAPPAAAVVEEPAPWQIDLRVGRIVEVARHPDADSLYVEKIDIGEAEPRTVVSGLVKYMTLEQMQGATLITVCNLKPANMRGVKSFAMVLCATSKEGKEGGGVEFVNPPPGSQPGDRVYFEGFADKTALEQLPPKRKIFETVQPGFTTLDNKDAAWVSPDGKVHKIVTEKGVCSAANFVGASLS